MRVHHPIKQVLAAEGDKGGARPFAKLHEAPTQFPARPHRPPPGPRRGAPQPGGGHHVAHQEAVEQPRPVGRGVDGGQQAEEGGVERVGEQVAELVALQRPCNGPGRGGVVGW